MPKASQITGACLLRLTKYHSFLSLGLLCQSSLTDTHISRDLGAMQDAKIIELTHLCPQELISLLISSSLMLPLCSLCAYLYLHLYLHLYLVQTPTGRGLCL